MNQPTTVYTTTHTNVDREDTLNNQELLEKARDDNKRFIEEAREKIRRGYFLSIV